MPSLSRLEDKYKNVLQLIQLANLAQLVSQLQLTINKVVADHIYYCFTGTQDGLGPIVAFYALQEAEKVTFDTLTALSYTTLPNTSNVCMPFSNLLGYDNYGKIEVLC